MCISIGECGTKLFFPLVVPAQIIQTESFCCKWGGFQRVQIAFDAVEMAGGGDGSANQADEICTRLVVHMYLCMIFHFVRHPFRWTIPSKCYTAVDCRHVLCILGTYIIFNIYVELRMVALGT